MKDFNAVIQEYLERRASSDPLFAPKYANTKKSIVECCRYILGEARKRGNQVVMTDEEVFGLAVHYYDEDNIKISGSGKCNVSSSQYASSKDIVEQQPAKSPLKRVKVKKEENKLQLSLFD